MRIFIQILECALLGVFTENLIFTAGIGTNRMLRMATRYKNLLLIAVYMFLFSSVTALVAPRVIQWMGLDSYTAWYWMLIFMAGLTVMYLLVIGLVYLLRKKCPGFAALSKQVLPGCAYNCIIVSMPFIMQKSQFTILEAIGYCLGASVGLVLAVKLVRQAIRRLNDPQVTEGFSGIPSLMIYIGILSMVFIAISGQPFLFF